MVSGSRKDRRLRELESLGGMRCVELRDSESELEEATDEFLLPRQEMEGRPLMLESCAGESYKG